MDAQNMYERDINKYIKQNCAPSWIYLREHIHKIYLTNITNHLHISVVFATIISVFYISGSEHHAS